MEELVRSSIIELDYRASIEVNLTIPTPYDRLNVLCGYVCNKRTRKCESYVDVNLRDFNNSIYFSTKSNMCGEYMLINIPMGKYLLIFSKNNIILEKNYIIIGSKMSNFYNAFVCF